MKKQLSEQARVASCIRKDLKATFPETKFRVTSCSFSMGNSVDVRWENGPTSEQVDAIVSKYKDGHFNGMEDLYEYSENKDGLPRAKYVITQRKVSEEFMLKAAQAVAEDFGLKAPESVAQLGDNEPCSKFPEFYNWYAVSQCVLSRLDLTGCVSVEKDEDFECGSLFEGYKGVKV